MKKHIVTHITEVTYRYEVEGDSIRTPDDAIAAVKAGHAKQVQANTHERFSAHSEGGCLGGVATGAGLAALLNNQIRSEAPRDKVDECAPPPRARELPAEEVSDKFVAERRASIQARNEQSSRSSTDFGKD